MQQGLCQARAAAVAAAALAVPASAPSVPYSFDSFFMKVLSASRSKGFAQQRRCLLSKRGPAMHPL